MKKDFQYFYKKAKKLIRADVKEYGPYELAICMQESYDSGYEDCAEKYKYPGRDPIDTL